VGEALTPAADNIADARRADANTRGFDRD